MVTDPNTGKEKDTYLVPVGIFVDTVSMFKFEVPLILMTMIAPHPFCLTNSMPKIAYSNVYECSSRMYFQFFLYHLYNLDPPLIFYLLLHAHPLCFQRIVTYFFQNLTFDFQCKSNFPLY